MVGGGAGSSLTPGVRKLLPARFKTLFIFAKYRRFVAFVLWPRYVGPPSSSAAGRRPRPAQRSSAKRTPQDTEAEAAEDRPASQSGRPAGPPFSPFRRERAPRAPQGARLEGPRGSGHGPGGARCAGRTGQVFTCVLPCRQGCLPAGCPPRLPAAAPGQKWWREPVRSGSPPR